MGWGLFKRGDAEGEWAGIKVEGVIGDETWR